MHNINNSNFVQNAGLKNETKCTIIKSENRKGETNEQVTQIPDESPEEEKDQEYVSLLERKTS